jgi:predicted metal-binding protein
MQAKVMQYKRLLVVQTAWDVSDVMNTEETAAAKVKHNAISFKILDRLKELGLTSDAMMAGPCKQCKKVCMEMIGEPCPRDYKVYSCLSAYCIDVTKLAETLGMECWCGNTRVLYFSMFMFDK